MRDPYAVKDSYPTPRRYRELHGHAEKGSCNCKPRNVRVTKREYNVSAFNGYKRTPSAYSEVVCGTCGWRWRTKAAWVATTPDVGTDYRPGDRWTP